MPGRSSVYIDGFNLYYGLLKNSPYKWLNLQRYFELLRPHDDLQRIHYFTARVGGKEQSARQNTYLRALSTQPLLNIVEGRFKLTEKVCRVSACTHSGPRKFKAPEEKRTDVNIALQIVQDAYENLCDNFILVSADSDLAPALDMVKARFPEKKIIAYVPRRYPQRGSAAEIRNAADKSRDLPAAPLRHAQFPGQVPDTRGGSIAKPPTW